MSSVMNFIKSLPTVEDSELALVTDKNYIRRSSVLVNDALQKGFDVMQMPDGDIMITEVKTVVYKYKWNKERGRFERTSSGPKARRNITASNS